MTTEPFPATLRRAKQTVEALGMVVKDGLGFTWAGGCLSDMSKAPEWIANMNGWPIENIARKAALQMPPFPIALRAAMAGLSVRRAALLLSYHPRSVSRWLAGSRTPHEAVQAQVIAQLNQRNNTK